MDFTKCKNPYIYEKRYLSSKQLAFDEAFKEKQLSSIKDRTDQEWKSKNSGSTSQTKSTSQPSTLTSLDGMLLMKTHEILKRLAKEHSSSEGKLDAAIISMLVDILANGLKIKFKKSLVKDKVDDFSCSICKELFYDPVTLTCGHSFCKKCAIGDSNCKICSSPTQGTSFRVNIALNSVVQKFHVAEYVGRSLCFEADRLMREQQILQAVLKYTEAIESSPYSHIAHLQRARAYYEMGNWTAALEDAVRAENLVKHWPEVYFIKGEILESLKIEDGALLSFLTCLALDASNTLAKSHVHKIIMNIWDEEVSKNTISAMKLKRSGSDNVSLQVPCKRTNFLPVITLEELDYDEETNTDYVEEDLTFTIKSNRSKAQGNKKSDENLEVLVLSTLKMEGTTEIERNSLRASEKVEEKGTVSVVGHDKDSTGPTSPLNNAEKFSPESIIVEFTANMMENLHGMGDLIAAEEAEEVKFIPPNLPRIVDSSLINEEDFECSLCMQIYFNPVCTSCGHSFCRQCLERCLDHNTPCPLCKTTIKPTLKNDELVRPSTDLAMDSIIRRFLPTEFKECLKVHEDEIKILQQSIPVFVCTIAFPSVSCPLHVYEPRYRLMLRRVMDIHGEEFGMCKESCDDKPFQQIGTIIRVKKASFFPDGRSVVESIGLKRFKVLEYGMSDAYHTAKVEYIVDQHVNKPEDQTLLTKLSELVYVKAKEWYQSLQFDVKDKIQKHFGDFPLKNETMSGNGPNWTWWILAVLPIEDKIKLLVLSKNLLRERLLIMNKILTCLKKKQQS